MDANKNIQTENLNSTHGITRVCEYNIEYMTKSLPMWAGGAVSVGKVQFSMQKVLGSIPSKGRERPLHRAGPRPGDSTGEVILTSKL